MRPPTAFLLSPDSDLIFDGLLSQTRLACDGGEAGGSAVGDDHVVPRIGTVTNQDSAV